MENVHQPFNAHFSYIQQFLADHNLAPFKKVYLSNFFRDDRPKLGRIDPFTGELTGDPERQRNSSYGVFSKCLIKISIWFDEIFDQNGESY